MTTAQVGINDRFFPEKCGCFASDTTEITEMSALIKQTIEYPVLFVLCLPWVVKGSPYNEEKPNERTPP